jgi:hypothetical protein
MRTIATTDVTQIYYQDSGTGPRVVLSHGWPLSSDAWDRQSLFYAQHGYDAVAHDRRGHGHSSPASFHNNMNGYPDDLPAIMDIPDLRDAFDEQVESKEELVSAFLKDRPAIWIRWFESEIEARFEATGGGLEIIADVLQVGFEDPKCLGLAFINILIEGGDFNNEPVVIVGEQKEHLRLFIEQLAVKMGLRHPDMAAAAAVRVIERAIVCTLMTGSLTEAQTARLLFQCLQHV